MEKQERGKKAPPGKAIQVGGLLKTLGSFLEVVSDMIERGEEEIRREGAIGFPGEKGFRAVYGFSVKLGAGGQPSIESFGNVPKMTPRGPVIEEMREPLADVFDEGQALHVVVELPGIKEPDIAIEVKEDILLIAAGTGVRKYSKEILLPTRVKTEEMQRSFRNGILELHLKKLS